jgi:hypothetical protein
VHFFTPFFSFDTLKGNLGPHNSHVSGVVLRCHERAEDQQTVYDILVESGILVTAVTRSQFHLPEQKPRTPKPKNAPVKPEAMFVEVCFKIFSVLFFACLRSKISTRN